MSWMSASRNETNRQAAHDCAGIEDVNLGGEEKGKTRLDEGSDI
jgi:hypothetical protein